MAGSRPLAAYCEDANSDDSDTQTDTRQHSGSGGHANVAAKRSHPSDLNHDKPGEVVGPDAASDSGYSSHTAATMSSADSAQSHQSSPPTSAGTGPAPSPSRRRPTLDSTRERSSQNSPRKPLVRNGSSARRQDREEECKVPNCQCKQSQSQSQRRSRRPPPSSLDSALDVRSQRSDPPSNYYTPPSPQSARQPQPYAQGSAIIQPASSVRRRTSSASRPRPVSYHSGVPSEAGGYWVPGMPYPTPPGERGPPPAMSAHYAPPQMQPFPTMGQTPPNYIYPPGHPMYSPPYDPSRPPLAHRNSSQYSTRRPTSQYGAPVISYESQPYQSSTAAARPAPSARYDSRRPPACDSASSSSESESEEEADRRRMPPPQRRPSLRNPNSNSSNSYNDRMTQSQTLPPRERDRESRPSRPSTTAPSRASSVRRPSLSHAPKSVSYSNSAGNAKVVVESATSRRRQSYMGHELAYELEAKHRNHPIYRGETVVNNSQPRRRTDADVRRPNENNVDSKRRDAEAYQQQMRGDASLPLTEQLLTKAQKRSSRVPSGGSEVGSTRSKNSHDRASRMSASGQSIITNPANGEIKLRIDGSTNFNLQLSGGERTIRVEEAENGMRELTIATPRESGPVYRSERGSVTGRRPLIMSRRDAEEDVRSRRSSRSGRAEAERRPLRRSTYQD